MPRKHPQALLLLCSLCVLGFGACKRKDADARQQPAHEVASETTTTRQVPAAPPPPRVPTTSAELDGSTTAKSAASQPAEVGIPECDRYIEKHYRCVTEHVPKQMRKLALEGLNSSARAWRQAAQRGSDIARLRLACELLAEQSDAAMKRYGCKY